MKRRNKSGVFAAIRMAARAHHVLTVGTILCVASSVVASLLPPLLLARIIDGLTAGLPLTLWAVLAYFCSLALEGVLSSAQESLLVLFGQKMTHALRSEMSHKLTQLPASTLVDQNPGEVAARFSGDVDTVEALFTSGIISMVADACRILSIMAVIAVKNTGLALILLLVLPLFAAFTRHVQRRMLAAQLDNRRAVAAVSGQVPETLHNIRTIRALGTEAYMERRYDKRIADGYAAMERTNFYDAIYSPVVLLLNAVVVAIVMLLSASGNATVLTLFGMSVGTSVAIINYISRIFAPIESLGMEIQTIQSAMAGVKRIDAFLTQPERTIPGERQKAARGDVELAHVTFGYGEKQVLNDFSMTVHQGEQVTLIGRTGAGKSTIFKLLLGLYPPESGSVTIGGVPVADITDRERRTCISCVEQHFARVPGTVLDQITLGDPQITAEMAKNAAQLAGIDTAIRALPDGYDTVCSEGMFSQGEWQLLSIARAAAADPAVLLLDEITANLDAETEARVLDALRRASEGRTVLSVSHRIYENLGGRTVEIKIL
ncbi:MAG: ABC transporter ATP-binding protein/permease [Subdoligranulum variabile]|nr:ABC transporter ATP-binding protein/permease [Subdoligranulum variabile]